MTIPLRLELGVLHQVLADLAALVADGRAPRTRQHQQRASPIPPAATTTDRAGRIGI